MSRPVKSEVGRCAGGPKHLFGVPPVAAPDDVIAGRPLGSRTFIETAERLLGRRLRPRPAGRPARRRNRYYVARYMSPDIGSHPENVERSSHEREGCDDGRCFAVEQTTRPGGWLEACGASGLGGSWSPIDQRWRLVGYMSVAARLVCICRWSGRRSVDEVVPGHA